jgi:hypothetical protein
LYGVSGFNLTVTPIDPASVIEHADYSYIKVLYIGDFTSIGTITVSLANGTIAGANAALNASMSNGTSWERDALSQLGLDFDNQVHLATSGPNILVQITTSPNVKSPLLTYLNINLYDGDVLYDDKQYLDAVLPDKLVTGGYDLLVIGSGIDQNTLTASAVKTSIDTFVRAGGTLMVFGSTANNYNWLQPLFSAQSANVAGNVTATDPGHPILSYPWTLNWGQYNDQNLAWDLGSSSSLFEHILSQGGKDVMAVSKPGSFGSGHVLVTSYQPKLVGQALGVAEAQHFIFNMVLYQDGPGTNISAVQYGPTPPHDLPVSSAESTTVLYDPVLGPVPVKIRVLTWATK